jgi:quinol monooxygenase YgiN
MSKVIFTIQYELKEDKKEEFLNTVNELKNLLNADGLEDYSVFRVKGKQNQYQEQYTFESEEAFDVFDDILPGILPLIKSSDNPYSIKQLFAAF